MLSSEIGVLVVALFLSVLVCRNSQSLLHPLPPGPKKLPLLGNLFVMPSTYAWKVWAEWGKLYNTDILHMKVPGQSIIVLNSYGAAKELLERRSAIYSSRPTSVMLSQLSGFGYQFGLMPYGESWRSRRRLFKKYFNMSSTAIYRIPEAKYLHRFLHQLLEHPTDFVNLLHHMTGAISISMTYGIDISSENDPNFEIALLARQTIRECLTVGSALVDMFPALKYLPTWFPGAKFHRIAAKSRIYAAKSRDCIFDNAYQKWSKHRDPDPSFVSLGLENLPNEESEEYMSMLKDVAGNVYMAASDTISTAVQTFVLAMTCHPDIRKRAQHELDEVVGRDRLPTHTDEPHLPYFCAVVKEALRWQSIVPTGVAHQCISDDIYNGYYIPKHSSVLYNAWAMLNNESDYPEPRQFRPERFLTSNGMLRKDDGVRDPIDIVFGFGRRICPGAHIGYSILWLTAASLLTVFDIDKTLDADGHPIEPSCEYNSGAVSYPLPFECTIKPRSRESVRLIQDIMESSETSG